MVTWVVIVTGLLGFLAVQAVKQDGWTFEWIGFFSAAFAILYWQGFLVVFGASDIIIDNESISRRLFGITWKRIAWDNMSKVLCFEVYYSRWHTNVMAYNLFPKNKPRMHIFPSGKMWITGNFKGVGEFKDLVNKFVSKYEIQVQRKQNGFVVTIDQII